MSKTTPGNPPAPAVPPAQDKTLEFLERARNGDPTTLPTLKKMLQDPAAIKLLGGDLADQAEASLIDRAGAKNLGFKEALRRKLSVLRDELAGPNPAPLERLLAERVAACWLWVHYYETLLAQSEGQLTITQGAYQHKRLDHAHRRYLASLKTLALVRKLAVPVLQVNIAKRQVNVAGPAAAPEEG